jgi:glutathione S-transferase
MLRLLGRATSGNVQKVLWLLEELGLEYRREDFGRQFGNTADAAYLDLNPTGKVPTLVDGDTVIWESNTILRYVCARAGSDLLPPDPAARSAAERWMDWQLASLNGPYLDVFRESRKSEAERSPDLPALGEALAAQLRLLDDRLGGRDWLGDGAMTVAEFALGPIVHRCLNFPVERPAFKDLRRWHDRLSGRDGFQKVVAA